LCIEKDLLALGYTPQERNRVIARDNYHFFYFHPKNGLSVEIHWELAGSNLPFQVDLRGLWSRAQSITLTQVHATALALSPEDLLLYLCLHTAKHTHTMQLKMLCDIGR